MSDGAQTIDPKDQPPEIVQVNDQDPPWMQAFGGLRDLKQETRRIQRIIDKEFGKIDEEDWR